MFIGAFLVGSRRLLAPLITVASTTFLLAQSVPPGGAPPPGSGNIDHQGFVRVIEGDTVEIRIGGSLVGIGFTGVQAPMGNTDCGKQAANALRSLVAQGMYAEADADETFDDRGRRMYYAYTRGRDSIGLQLVRNGVARATGRGKEAGLLIAAENRARAERLGCLWGGVGQNSIEFTPEDVLASEQKSAEPNQSVGLKIAEPAAATVQPAAAAAAAGFVIETVASGLVQPTAFAWLPDGRILVTQKRGEVRLIKNSVLQANNVINLAAVRVNDYWDRGLLGIAVDPDFATNGYFYLLYTYENDPNTWNSTKTAHLARYTMVGDTASIASELPILGKVTGSTCDTLPAGSDCIPSDSPSHSVGTLKFAPDGNLFVTTGDGAHFNFVDDRALRAQNKSSLSGKVLRISRTGQGVTGNPFVADAGGNLNANPSKVWAYGVRNSYRFNLHPTAGIPYLGDVGWNSWEEVNVASAGANLGWPCYEGAAVQNGYQPKLICQSLYNAGSAAVKNALVPYSHAGAGAAVTGGAFYTGTSYPTQYRGAFFYGDYSTGSISYLQTDANHALLTPPAQFASQTDGPVAIEMGADGALYYLAINVGELRKIRYTGAGGAPNAVISATPMSGPLPLAVNFSSAGSTDPENGVLTYVWNFGDGTPTTSEPNPVHVYNTNGSYTASLTVRDPEGMTNTKSLVISVSPNTPPTASVSSPLSSVTYKVGDVVSFSGSATDQQDGTLPASSLSWSIITHHCPGGVCHMHPYQTVNGVSSGSFRADDHGDDSYFEVILTASDSTGLTGKASVMIQPLTVQTTLTTGPAGLTLNYNGTPVTSPWTRRIIVGGVRTIAAPATQGSRTFSSWSDSGVASHTIKVGSANATYTAYYGPPIISSVTARVTGNRVVVTWNTHEPANSQVEYGTTSALGQSTPVQDMPPLNVQQHSVTLQGLQRRTTYFFSVRSTDPASLTSTSAVLQFDTK